LGISRWTGGGVGQAPRVARRTNPLVEINRLDPLLCTQTYVTKRNCGTTEVCLDRVAANAELGRKFLHGLAGLVHGHECLQLSRLQGSAGEMAE
jgi:hypothetical protein